MRPSIVAIWVCTALLSCSPKGTDSEVTANPVDPYAPKGSAGKAGKGSGQKDGQKDGKGAGQGQGKKTDKQDANGSKINAGRDELAELGKKAGISPATMAEGKVYVGAWKGTKDEIPAEVQWALKIPAPSTPTTPTTPGDKKDPPPGDKEDPPATSGDATAASDAVTFNVPAQLINGGWNTPETAVVVPVGGSLTVINSSGKDYWIHTNGPPFPHPNDYIRDGGQATYTMREAFDGNVYEHDGTPNAFKFYLKVQ